MGDNDKPETGDKEALESAEDTLLDISATSGDSTPEAAPAEPSAVQPESAQGGGETLLEIGSLGDANQSILFKIDSAAGSHLASASIDLPASDTSSSTQSSQSFTQRNTSGRHNKLRYDKLGELGRGGMGIVLKVKDNDLRREVAMKVIRGDRRDNSAMQSFVEEAQITGQLEHPNIVPVHELGSDADGQIFFTMKMVRGQPLSQVLKAIKNGDADTASRHTLDRMLQILLKVCDAVSFAAARGVVHRDLKPENIMLGRFGEVVVMDWGLARVQGGKDDKHSQTSIFTDHTVAKATDSESTSSSAFSMEGSIAGTPAYMAPEQARGEISKINESTDVFALGAILCEMLCLSGPYLSKGRKDTLEEAADGDVTSPLQRLDIDSDRKDKLLHLPSNRIPPELDAVAMKAMETRQKDRYESVRALKEDVENFIAGRAVTVRDDSMTVQISKWVRRHPTLSISSTAAAAVILLAAVVISFVVAEDKRQDAIQQTILAEAQADKAEASRKAAEASEKAAANSRIAEVASKKAAEASARAAESSRKAERDAKDLAEAKILAAAKEKDLREAASKRELATRRRTTAEAAYHKGAAVADRAFNFTDKKLRDKAVSESELALRNAMKADPTYIDPVFKLARLFDKNGDKRAIDFYEKTSKLMHGDPRSLFHAAEFARFRQRNNRSAKGYYDDCIDLRKGGPITIVAQGHSAFLDNNPEQAMRFAKSAQKADSKLWEAWYLSGYIRAIEFLPNGDRNSLFNPRLAVKHLDRAESRSVREVSVYHVRGLAKLEDGQLDAAIEDLETATRLYPDWEAGQIDLAVAYLSRGKTRAAIDLIDELRPITKTNANVSYVFGIVSYQQEDYEKAKELFKSAISIDDDHLAAKNWLTRTYVRLSLVERAIRNARFTVKEHPQSAEALATYALSLIADKNSVEAQEKIKEAHQLRRDWPIALAIESSIVLADELNISYSMFEHCENTALRALAVAGQWEAPHRILGSLYVVAGRYEEAETHLSAALTIQPTNVDARYRLGVCYRHLGRHEESGAILKTLIDNLSIGGSARFEMGTNFLAQEKWEEGRVWFVKTGEAYPNFGPAWINAAVCASNIGNYELAREYAYKAAEASPDHVLSWVQVCQAEIAAGNTEKATEAIDKALECASGDQVSWTDVAQMLFYLSRYTEAISRCDRVLSVFPNYTRAWIVLGKSSYQLKQFDNAQKAYKRASDSDPTNIEPVILIAELYFERGLYHECIKTCKKVLYLSPTSARANYFMGMAWAAAGEDRTGAEYLEVALHFSPNDSVVLLNLMKAQFRLGDYSECKRSAIDLLKLEPKNTVAWYLKAQCYYQLGRWSKAVAAFKELVEIDSSLYAGLYYLAISQLNNGEHQEALKSADRYLKIKDFDPDIYVIVAITHLLMEKPDETLLSLRKALKSGVPKARVFDNPSLTALHETDGWKALKKDFPTD